jgi:hypothetical protein
MTVKTGWMGLQAKRDVFCSYNYAIRDFIDGLTIWERGYQVERNVHGCPRVLSKVSEDFGFKTGRMFLS